MATTDWSNALSARVHLVSFYTFVEALFPEASTGGGALSGKVALDTLTKLRASGFRCSDQWECVVSVVQLERLLESRQYSEVVRACDEKAADAVAIVGWVGVDRRVFCGNSSP